MPILNKIFHKSFGNVEGNMKAVSDCGWFPSNRKLFEHPSLINDACCESDAATSSVDASSLSTPSATAVTLNIGVVDGMVATVLDHMLTERAKTDANGIHSLSNPKFLESFKERQSAKSAKRNKAASVKRAKKKKIASVVKTMREKHGHEVTHQFLKCSNNKCVAYLQYKKQDTDHGMPERRLRCREWASHPSPLTSICQSEDKEGEDVSSQAAVALLAFASVPTLGEDNKDEEDYCNGMI